MASRPKQDPTPPTFEVEVNLDSSSAMAARPRRDRKQTDLLTPEQLDHLQRSDRATLQDVSLQQPPSDGPPRPGELPAFRGAARGDSGQTASPRRAAPASPQASAATPPRPEPPSLLHSVEAGRPTRLMISRQPKLILGVVLALAAFLGLIGGVAGGLYFLGGQSDEQRADDEERDDEEPAAEEPDEEPAPDDDEPSGASAQPDDEAAQETPPQQAPDGDEDAAQGAPAQGAPPRTPRLPTVAPRRTPSQEAPTPEPAAPAEANPTTPPPAGARPATNKSPTQGKDKRRYQMVD